MERKKKWRKIKTNLKSINYLHILLQIHYTYFNSSIWGGSYCHFKKLITFFILFQFFFKKNVKFRMDLKNIQPECETGLGLGSG